jgi:ring-1,2-phenylacetyl-CoA epoxidase subunit PaaC
MATTSIVVADTPLVRLALARADDALILGHRLSEWCGHGPVLEEDLALTNIALDLIGQARELYQLAGAETGHDEDALAYRRDERAFTNLLLVEQPNGDFARTIARQFLYSAYIDPYWQALAQSPEPRLAAIAAKAEKESAYHLRHSAEWLIRLGDGTEESHRRAQAALDGLWPFSAELFTPISPLDIAVPRGTWETQVDAVLARATLSRPADTWQHDGGRTGRHTEHLGHLLAEMQYLARVHPGATW